MVEQKRERDTVKKHQETREKLKRDGLAFASSEAALNISKCEGVNVDANE